MAPTRSKKWVLGAVLGAFTNRKIFTASKYADFEALFDSHRSMKIQKTAHWAVFAFSDGSNFLIQFPSSFPEFRNIDGRRTE